MATAVTLDYFSGIRNPHWDLSPTQLGELRARLHGLPVVHLDQRRQKSPLVGYNGTHVKSTDGEVPDLEVCAGFVIEHGKRRVCRKDPDRQMERWLVDATAPDTLGRTFGLSFNTVNRRRAANPIAGLPANGTFGGVRWDTAPAFTGNVAPWNDPSKANNCYSYANDEPAPGFWAPVPGRDDNNVTYSADALMTGALQDGLEPVQGNFLHQAAPAYQDAHYLVICLREQTGQARDFHCLRLDKTGIWSHKDGTNRVRKTDDTGKVIRDLRTAKFNGQLTFVGLFLSVKGRRRIFQA